MIAPFPWARSICPRAVCSARSRSVVTGSLLSSRGVRARRPFTSTTGSTVSMVRLASVFVKAVLQRVVGMDWRCGWDAVGRRDGRRVRAHRVGRTFVLYSLDADVTSPKLGRRAPLDGQARSRRFDRCRWGLTSHGRPHGKDAVPPRPRGRDSTRARDPRRDGPRAPRPVPTTETKTSPAGLCSLESGPATPVMPTPRSAS